MRNRTMEDYLERVHQENERLRKIIDDQSDAYDGAAHSAITHESAMRWWRIRARKYSLENAGLRAVIADKDAILHHSAVAATAARNRINDLEDQIKAITASSSPEGSQGG